MMMMMMICDVTLLAPTLHQLLRTISLLGRWSLSGSDRGIAHFYGYKKFNQGSGRKEKKQTNEQHEPGINSKGKTRSYVTLCFPVSIYRLTLAWISRENSTTHKECWLILTRLPSLLRTSFHPTVLSAVRCRPPCPSSVANCFLRVALSNYLTRVSLPTSGHAEISSPKPFVWFRTKTDKEIVCLSDHLHSVTDI